MAGKVFTKEQKKLLSSNPNVESVEATRIIYTEEFKKYYVKNYLEGKKPTEIFISAGFDPSILGNKRIERASARWRKLYEDGSLDIAIEETKENTTVTDATTAPVKKRRGRPRKNPVVVTEETTPKEAPKKKRGRPKKVVQVETTAKEEQTPKKTVRKRVNKIALMAQNMNKPLKQEADTIKETPVDTAVKTEKVEEIIQPVKTKKAIKTIKEEASVKNTMEAPKKRRGRPRKNPIVENTSTEEITIVKPEELTADTVQPAKKRRGRPRKNVTVDTKDIKDTNTVDTVKKVATVDENTVKNVSTEIKISEQATPKSIETIKEINAKINEDTNTDNATTVSVMNSLLDAINKLTKEVNSLKRQIARNKKIIY